MVGRAVIPLADHNEADNAIESRLEAVFLFERSKSSFVSLRQPHCGLCADRWAAHRQMPKIYSTYSQ